MAPLRCAGAQRCGAGCGLALTGAGDGCSPPQNCCIYSVGATQVGFAVCCSVSWGRASSILTRTHRLQTLEIKVVFWYLWLQWGGWCWSEGQLEKLHVFCPGSRCLGKGADSSELPITCSTEPVLKALTVSASISPGEWSEGAPGRWDLCCNLKATPWARCGDLAQSRDPTRRAVSSTVCSIQHSAQHPAQCTGSGTAPGWEGVAKALGWAGE